MDFKSMSRRELQALCKKHRLPANTTKSIMAESLASLLQGSDKIKPKGCLKASGQSSGEDAGGRRPTKKVAFILQEEVLRFGGSKAIRSPETRRSSRRRSVIGSEQVDLSKEMKEKASARSTRARSAAGSVSYSPAVEVEGDCVSVGGSKLGISQVRKRGNSKDEGEKLEKNDKIGKGEARKRSRGVVSSEEGCAQVGSSDPSEEEPPPRRSRRNLLKSENSLVANGGIRSGEGIEAREKSEHNTSQISNGEDKNCSSAHEEDENLAPGRRKSKRKPKKIDPEAEKDTETWPLKPEAPMRRSTRKSIVSDVLEKDNTSLAGGKTDNRDRASGENKLKRESKRTGARCASKRNAATSSEDVTSLPELETKEETRTAVEANEGPRRSRRNTSKHTATGVEITLPVTEKGINGNIINGGKKLRKRNASEVDVSTVVTDNLVGKKADKAKKLQKQQSVEVAEKPVLEAHVANCGTFSEAEVLEDCRPNKERKQRSKRNVSKNKSCAAADEITEKMRVVKSTKAAPLDEVIPTVESEAVEVVGEATKQNDLNLNRSNENSCQQGIGGAAINDASDHKLSEETPSMLGVNDMEGLVIVFSDKKQSSQNYVKNSHNSEMDDEYPNKEAQNCKYREIVCSEDSNTAEQLDGSVIKLDSTSEMEYDGREISISECLDTSCEIIKTALEENVCCNGEPVLNYDCNMGADSETVSYVDKKDFASSSVVEQKHEKQINNQQVAQFIDSECGGSIFKVDGCCISEVSLNSQYIGAVHADKFSSQVASEASPLNDQKTPAMAVEGYTAVEAANNAKSCSITNIFDDQGEALRPSNVAYNSKSWDYSEKLEGVVLQTGPCSVAPKIILSVERTSDVCNGMSDFIKMNVFGQTQMYEEVDCSHARAAKDDATDYSGDDKSVASKSKVDLRNLEEAEVGKNEESAKLVGDEISYKLHIQDVNDAADDLSVKIGLSVPTSKRTRQEVGTDLDYSSVDLRTSDNLQEHDVNSIALKAYGEVSTEKSEEAIHKTTPISANTKMTTADEVTVTMALSGKNCRLEDGEALGFSHEQPNLSSMSAEFAGGRDATVEERSICNSTKAELLLENIEAIEKSSSGISLIENKSIIGPIQQSCSLDSRELMELSSGISADNLVAKFEAAVTQKKLDKTIEKLFLVLSTLRDGNSVTGATIYTDGISLAEDTEEAKLVQSNQLPGPPDCIKIQEAVNEAKSRSHLFEKVCGGNIDETSGTEQETNTPNDITQTFELDFVGFEENAESCTTSKNVVERNNTGTISEERSENDKVDNLVTPGALLPAVYAEEDKQSSLSGSTNLMPPSSGQFQVVEKTESPGKYGSRTAALIEGGCNWRIEETVDKVGECLSTPRHSLIGLRDLSSGSRENSLADDGFALERISCDSGKKGYHVSRGSENSVASQPTVDLRYTEEADAGKNEESEDHMKLVEKNAGCKGHNQCDDNDGKHCDIDEVSFDSMSPEFIIETNWAAPGAHLPSLETLFCMEREVPSTMTDCSRATIQETSVDTESCEFSGETSNNGESSHRAVQPMEGRKMTMTPFLSGTTVENEVEVQKNFVNLTGDFLGMIDGNESDEPLEVQKLPGISTSNVDELESKVADDLRAKIAQGPSADGDRNQVEGTNLGHRSSVDRKTSDKGEASVTKKSCTEVVEPYAEVSFYTENTDQDCIEKHEAIDKTAPDSATTEMNITKEITVSKELDSEEQLHSQGSDFSGRIIGTAGEQYTLNKSAAELLLENVEVTEESSHESSFAENRSVDGLIQRDFRSDSREVMEVSSGISADNHVSKLEDSSRCRDRMEEISHQLPSLSIFSAKKFGSTSCNAAITADKNKENTPAVKMYHSNKRNADKPITKSSLRRPLQVIHSSKAEEQL